jgi:hypothetical protein
VPGVGESVFAGGSVALDEVAVNFEGTGLDAESVAPGALGAVKFVVDNLTTLYRELKARRFSTVGGCRFEPENSLRIWLVINGTG